MIRVEIEIRLESVIGVQWNLLIDPSVHVLHLNVKPTQTVIAYIDDVQCLY